VRLRASILGALLVLLGAVALGACGVGSGDSDSDGATLTVSRDFGRRVVTERRAETVPGGETVMRFLQRYAEVDTGYGGRFVDAIEGLRSGSRRGERRDWFYYVNGIEADVGAAEKRLSPSDRVWWDYHDWSAAMRIPAVVGSFPEPFLHGEEGKRYPVRIDCAQEAAETCDRVAERLDAAGIAPSTTALGAPAGKEVLRLVVGEWPEVREDAAARLIEEGPTKSGVFARFVSGPALELLDARGRTREKLHDNAGLVAATRFEEQMPTWVVTGTDAAGLENAARLLGESTLRDRFAVANDGTRELALPVRP
jgi:hypothetical protein